MSETEEHQESAVQQVRRVRDQLNREIEATSGKALLDQIQGHRYTSPVLQRLALKAASKAASKAEEPARSVGTPSGSG
jgi:hypothetical protein